MKSLSILITAAVMLFACGSNTQTENRRKDVGTKCYRYADERDSIRMSFQQENNLILGELSYRFFEKDKNDGSIRGVVLGDTIFAEYTFYSEGKESVREVAFLKKDSVLMEGFGETTTLNDKQVFVNKKTLQYDSKIFLSEVACD